MQVAGNDEWPSPAIYQGADTDTEPAYIPIDPPDRHTPPHRASQCEDAILSYLTSMGNSMLKERRPVGRLFFNMGFGRTGKTGFFKSMGNSMINKRKDGQ